MEATFKGLGFRDQSLGLALGLGRKASRIVSLRTGV